MLRAMNAPAARRSPTLPRWLRLVLLWLAAAWLGYLLLGNLFLNTPLGHQVANLKPEKFRMHWRRGLTPWPGRVTVWDVDMSGHARRTAWSVQAGRASGRIALLPLLRREVRVPWVVADRVSGGVGRAEAELPGPEPRPGGWVLRFDRIASDSILAGTFFDEWSIQGPGSAEVGFRKRLRGGPMELFASKAEFPAAALGHRGEPFARGARIAATFAMDEHVSAQLPGLAKLGVVTASVELDATAMRLQAALDAEGRYRFTMQPGSGSVQARLALARGALAPGSRLHVSAPLVAVDAAGAARRNALDLRLDVDEDIRLRVDVPDTGASDAEPLMLDADLRIAGTALALGDWRQRLAGASGRLRTDWHFSSLSWLAGMFAPEGLLALEGRGAVQADLAIEDGRLQAGSRVEVPDVAATVAVAGQRFAGHARAAGTIADDGADGALRSRLELAMDGFDIAPDEDGAASYVSGTDLRLDVVADGDLARMQDSAVAHLRFTDAQVPDLRAYNRYLPAGQVRFLGGRGWTSGELRIGAGGLAGDGRLRVDGRGARISFAGLDVRGDVAIDARLQRADLKDGAFALGGSTLRLRNGAFAGSDGQARSGWWADVSVADGRFQAGERPRIRGDVNATVKDVDFLLALFASRADYPRWIVRLVDSGRAEVTGRVQWQDDAFVLDRAHAHNDRFHVDARLRMRGSHPRGDLYARWGVLGVGVELDGGERRFHLRNARAWYQGRPHLLP